MKVREAPDHHARNSGCGEISRVASGAEAGQNGQRYQRLRFYFNPVVAQCDEFLEQDLVVSKRRDEKRATRVVGAVANLDENEQQVLDGLPKIDLYEISAPEEIKVNTTIAIVSHPNTTRGKAMQEYQMRQTVFVQV